MVTPADPRYPDLTSGINQRWVAHPERIVLPRTADQVVAAVQEAVTAGKRLTVAGGGHCFEDFVFNPETEVVINLARMNAVTFDEERRAFAVEGGATLLDVYEALFGGWGVTLPGGICHSVGVGGHVTGGGFGMLSRQFGLVVDHLHAVEVVVVDASGTARTVIATRDADDPHRELLWAHTGGGGGNLGIVTRFWFRTPGATGTPDRLLPNPPSEVFITTVTWPWEEVTEDGFRTLIAHNAQWLHANNVQDTTASALFSWLLLNHRDSGSIGAIIQLDATLPDAAAVLSDYLAGLNDALGLPVTPVTRAGVQDSQYSATRRLPWLRGTRYIGSVSPTQLDPTMRGKHKSAHFKRPPTDAQTAALYRHLTETTAPGPFASAIFASAGGQISAVGPDETAVVQRQAIMKLNVETYWQDRSQDAANEAWVRGIYHDVFADTGGVPVRNDITDGCYINYPDGDLGDPEYNASGSPWHELYYGANYPRLQRAKRDWDPGNFFRHRQSIRP